MTDGRTIALRSVYIAWSLLAMVLGGFGFYTIVSAVSGILDSDAASRVIGGVGWSIAVYMMVRSHWMRRWVKMEAVEQLTTEFSARMMSRANSAEIGKQRNAIVHAREAGMDTLKRMREELL